MEDKKRKISKRNKKLLYGILAVCVVTLVVSGISVYEVNTVAKQLNTQGELIAALQEAQAPMNVLYVDLEEQLDTQGELIAALEQSRFRLIADDPMTDDGIADDDDDGIDEVDDEWMMMALILMVLLRIECISLQTLQSKVKVR
jgi:hypothetical protein